MLSAARSRTAVLAFAGASLVGVLAGCSSPSGSTAGSTGGTSGSSTSGSGASAPTASTGTAGAGTSGTGTSGTYKNGTYTEQGTYSSPGGQEVISVKLTIADDAVSTVDVKTVKADPTAAQYEKQFIGGIAKEVVGKKIADLNVTQVAGSSLTSQGFNNALSKIKTDAKA